MRKKCLGMGTILLLAMAYMLDTQGLFPYFIAAAGIHELGHLLAVVLCGGRLQGFEPVAFGFVLRFDAMMSYGEDAVIAAGGAALNILCAIVCSLCAPRVPSPESFYLFAGVNLLLGVFNLLPALPLDGGQVLHALLSKHMDISRAGQLIFGVSLCTGILISALGVYILVKTRYNMSILAVGALIIGGLYAARTGKHITAGS